MDEVMAFAWANSPSMDIPFSDKSMALRASPNGYPALVIREVQMDDGVIIFIPYGSRLGFHVGGPASTMANIDYKFPQCVCYEVQMDEKPVCLTPWDSQGNQVWDAVNDTTFTCLRGQGEAGYQASYILCRNTKNEKIDVVEMSHDLFSAKFGEDGKANTLAATDYNEPPVVCYSIGSMNSKGMLSENPTSGIHETKVARTIDANGSNPAGYQGGDVVVINSSGNGVGGQAHGVCYALEGNGSRPSHSGGGYSEDGRMYTLNTIERHSVCYAVENHPQDSRVTVDDSGVVQTLNAKMGTGGGQHADGTDQVGCFQNTGQGWWNQCEIAECLRTPCGGDSMKANLVAVRLRE